MTGRAGRPHVIADGVTWSGDVALRADVAMSVELIMAHAMAVETGSPVAYMGVRKGFIVLGQGKVRGVRGAGFIRDMEVGSKHGTLISKVIVLTMQERDYLSNTIPPMILPGWAILT